MLKEKLMEDLKEAMKEKEILKRKGQLESLAMIYDGIIVFTKK